jgi:hypothetical protein
MYRRSSAFLQYFLILFILSPLYVLLTSTEQVMAQNKTTSRPSTAIPIGSPLNITCSVTNTIAPSNVVLGLPLKQNTTVYIDRSQSRLPIHYSITGENSLNNITAETNTSTYLVNIFSGSNGSLKIELPKNMLILSKSSQAVNSPYLASDKQRLLSCQEIKDTSQTRILDIHFVTGTRVIKIIGNSFQHLPPIAKVTLNSQAVNENSSVKLNGSKSYDPEGGPLTYNWTQIAGKRVILNGANRPTATFNATTGVSNETFRLTVKNSANQNATASENVIVRHIALPPPAPLVTIPAPNSDFLYVVIIALAMTVPVMYDIRKGYQNRDANNRPTYTEGLGRMLMTFGIIILLGTVVFDVITTITHNIQSTNQAAVETNKQLVLMVTSIGTVLGGAVSSIIGFYFGSKAAAPKPDSTAGTGGAGAAAVVNTSPHEWSDTTQASTPIEATFSKPLDAATVKDDSLTLIDDVHNKNIAGKTSLGGDQKTIMFTPRSSKDLTPSHYIATISGVKDSAGDAIGSTTWKFTIKEPKE